MQTITIRATRLSLESKRNDKRSGARKRRLDMAGKRARDHEGYDRKQRDQEKDHRTLSEAGRASHGRQHLNGEQGGEEKEVQPEHAAEDESQHHAEGDAQRQRARRRSWSRNRNLRRHS